MAVCINLRNQNHCHSDSKHASRQVTSAHFANHQNDMILSKFQILIFKLHFGGMALLYHARECYRIVAAHAICFKGWCNSSYDQKNSLFH